ncbi:MAG: hypothetical protein JWO40_289 [Candidatus Doudnabacteria bacterium]|nr:hypothetical protein [Candidatus Doudnabacteria bacterium]
MFRDKVFYESSKIAFSRYDHDAHELEIGLHDGTLKVYKNVASADVLKLEECKANHTSVGDFYNQHISGIWEEKQSA